MKKTSNIKFTVVLKNDINEKGKVVEEFVADISDPMNRDMVETKLFGYKTINKKTEEINKYGYPRYMVSIVEIF